MTASPFQALGLPAQADLAQVKRAYARLLRTHRPDEDAAAFQRLHEAYQACLERIRWREFGYVEEDDEDETVPADVAIDDAAGLAADAGGNGTPHVDIPIDDPPLPDVAPPDDEPAPGIARNPAPAAREDAFHFTERFDGDAFLQELRQRMHADTPDDVEAWLLAHDALYSLERKHALGPGVVEALADVEPSLASRHYARITRFFGLDTVGGIEPWLQHRLVALLGRFDDAAAFERQLRAHAAPPASWTDQQLARELLRPVQWLRRLFLIACPGLPGRVGALVRSLQAADPASASTRLDPAARRFWERATDRSALHRERLALLGTRLALWMGPIAAYTAALGEGPGFLPDFAIGVGVLFALWLAYAFVVIGLLRLRDYIQLRLQWDWLLVVTAGGLVCGIVSVAAGGSGLIPFVITTIAWVGARNGGQAGYTTSQIASLATGAAGFGLAFLVLLDLADGAAIAARYLACAAMIFAFTSQMTHDLLFARARRLPLAIARLQPGWLWRMFQVQAVLAIVMSILESQQT